MDKNEILVPILTAINDLREEVRENRREIQKNREAIQINKEAIQKNRELINENIKRIDILSKKVDENTKRIESLSKKVDNNSEKIENIDKHMVLIEDRLKIHEEESKKDRKAILNILYSYEQVTDMQYKENKARIETLEERFKVISA